MSSPNPNRPRESSSNPNDSNRAVSTLSPTAQEYTLPTNGKSPSAFSPTHEQSLGIHPSQTDLPFGPSTNPLDALSPLGLSSLSTMPTLGDGSGITALSGGYHQNRLTSHHFDHHTNHGSNLSFFNPFDASTSQPAHPMGSAHSLEYHSSNHHVVSPPSFPNNSTHLGVITSDQKGSISITQQHGQGQIDQNHSNTTNTSSIHDDHISTIVDSLFVPGSHDEPSTLQLEKQSSGRPSEREQQNSEFSLNDPSSPHHNLGLQSLSYVGGGQDYTSIPSISLKQDFSPQIPDPLLLLDAPSNPMFLAPSLPPGMLSSGGGGFGHDLPTPTPDLTSPDAALQFASPFSAHQPLISPFDALSPHLHSHLSHPHHQQPFTQFQHRPTTPFASLQLPHLPPVPHTHTPFDLPHGFLPDVTTGMYGTQPQSQSQLQPQPSQQQQQTSPQQQQRLHMMHQQQFYPQQQHQQHGLPINHPMYYPQLNNQMAINMQQQQLLQNQFQTYQQQHHHQQQQQQHQHQMLLPQLGHQPLATNQYLSHHPLLPAQPGLLPQQSTQYHHQQQQLQQPYPPQAMPQINPWHDGIMNDFTLMPPMFQLPPYPVQDTSQLHPSLPFPAAQNQIPPSSQVTRTPGGTLEGEMAVLGAPLQSDQGSQANEPVNDAEEEDDSIVVADDAHSISIEHNVAVSEHGCAMVPPRQPQYAQATRQFLESCSDVGVSDRETMRVVMRPSHRAKQPFNHGATAAGSGLFTPLSSQYLGPQSPSQSPQTPLQPLLSQQTVSATPTSIAAVNENPPAVKPTVSPDPPLQQKSRKRADSNTNQTKTETKTNDKPSAKKNNASTVSSPQRQAQNSHQNQTTPTTKKPSKPQSQTPSVANAAAVVVPTAVTKAPSPSLPLQQITPRQETASIGTVALDQAIPSILSYIYALSLSICSNVMASQYNLDKIPYLYQQLKYNVFDHMSDYLQDLSNITIDFETRLPLLPTLSLRYLPTFTTSFFRKSRYCELLIQSLSNMHYDYIADLEVSRISLQRSSTRRNRNQKDQIQDVDQKHPFCNLSLRLEALQLVNELVESFSKELREYFSTLNTHSSAIIDAIRGKHKKKSSFPVIDECYKDELTVYELFQRAVDEEESSSRSSSSDQPASPESPMDSTTPTTHDTTTSSTQHHQKPDIVKTPLESDDDHETEEDDDDHDHSDSTAHPAQSHDSKTTSKQSSSSQKKGKVSKNRAKQERKKAKQQHQEQQKHTQDDSLKPSSGEASKTLNQQATSPTEISRQPESQQVDTEQLSRSPDNTHANRQQVKKTKGQKKQPNRLIQLSNRIIDTIFQYFFFPFEDHSHILLLLLPWLFTLSCIPVIFFVAQKIIQYFFFTSIIQRWLLIIKSFSASPLLSLLGIHIITDLIEVIPNEGARLPFNYPFDLPLYSHLIINHSDNQQLYSPLMTDGVSLAYQFLDQYADTFPFDPEFMQSGSSLLSNHQHSMRLNSTSSSTLGETTLNDILSREKQKSRDFRYYNPTYHIEVPILSHIQPMYPETRGTHRDKPVGGAPKHAKTGSQGARSESWLRQLLHWALDIWFYDPKSQIIRPDTWLSVVSSQSTSDASVYKPSQLAHLYPPSPESSSSSIGEDHPPSTPRKSSKTISLDGIDITVEASNDILEDEHHSSPRQRDHLPQNISAPRLTLQQLLQPNNLLYQYYFQYKHAKYPHLTNQAVDLLVRNMIYESYMYELLMFQYHATDVNIGQFHHDLSSVTDGRNGAVLVGRDSPEKMSLAASPLLHQSFAKSILFSTPRTTYNSIRGDGAAGSYSQSNKDAWMPLQHQHTKALLLFRYQNTLSSMKQRQSMAASATRLDTGDSNVLIDDSLLEAAQLLGIQLEAEDSLDSNDIHDKQIPRSTHSHKFQVKSPMDNGDEISSMDDGDNDGDDSDSQFQKDILEFFFNEFGMNTTSSGIDGYYSSFSSAIHRTRQERMDQLQAAIAELHAVLQSAIEQPRYQGYYMQYHRSMKPTVFQSPKSVSSKDESVSQMEQLATLVKTCNLICPEDIDLQQLESMKHKQADGTEKTDGTHSSFHHRLDDSSHRCICVVPDHMIPLWVRQQYPDFIKENDYYSSLLSIRDENGASTSVAQATSGDDELSQAMSFQSVEDVLARFTDNSNVIEPHIPQESLAQIHKRHIQLGKQDPEDLSPIQYAELTTLPEDSHFYDPKGAAIDQLDVFINNFGSKLSQSPSDVMSQWAHPLNLTSTLTPFGPYLHLNTSSTATALASPRYAKQLSHLGAVYQQVETYLQKAHQIEHAGHAIFTDPHTNEQCTPYVSEKVSISTIRSHILDLLKSSGSTQNLDTISHYLGKFLLNPMNSLSTVTTSTAHSNASAAKSSRKKGGVRNLLLDLCDVLTCQPLPSASASNIKQYIAKTSDIFQPITNFETYSINNDNDLQKLLHPSWRHLDQSQILSQYTLPSDTLSIQQCLSLMFYFYQQISLGYHGFNNNILFHPVLLPISSTFLNSEEYNANRGLFKHVDQDRFLIIPIALTQPLVEAYHDHVASEDSSSSLSSSTSKSLTTTPALFDAIRQSYITPSDVSAYYIITSFADHISSTPTFSRIGAPPSSHVSSGMDVKSLRSIASNVRSKLQLAYAHQFPVTYGHLLQRQIDIGEFDRVLVIKQFIDLCVHIHHDFKTIPQYRDPEFLSAVLDLTIPQAKRFDVYLSSISIDDYYLYTQIPRTRNYDLEKMKASYEKRRAVMLEFLGFPGADHNGKYGSKDKPISVRTREKIFTTVKSFVNATLMRKNNFLFSPDEIQLLQASLPWEQYGIPLSLQPVITQDSPTENDMASVLSNYPRDSLYVQMFSHIMSTSTHTLLPSIPTDRDLSQYIKETLPSASTTMKNILEDEEIFSAINYILSYYEYFDLIKAMMSTSDLHHHHSSTMPCQHLDLHTQSHDGNDCRVIFNNRYYKKYSYEIPSLTSSFEAHLCDALHSQPGALLTPPSSLTVGLSHLNTLFMSNVLQQTDHISSHPGGGKTGQTGYARVTYPDGFFSVVHPPPHGTAASATLYSEFLAASDRVEHAHSTAGLDDWHDEIFRTQRRIPSNGLHGTMKYFFDQHAIEKSPMYVGYHNTTPAYFSKTTPYHHDIADSLAHHGKAYSYRHQHDYYRVQSAKESLYASIRGKLPNNATSYQQQLIHEQYRRFIITNDQTTESSFWSLKIPTQYLMNFISWLDSSDEFLLAMRSASVLSQDQVRAYINIPWISSLFDLNYDASIRSILTHTRNIPVTISHYVEEYITGPVIDPSIETTLFGRDNTSTGITPKNPHPQSGDDSLDHDSDMGSDDVSSLDILPLPTSHIGQRVGQSTLDLFFVSPLKYRHSFSPAGVVIRIVPMITSVVERVMRVIFPNALVSNVDRNARADSHFIDAHLVTIASDTPPFSSPNHSTTAADHLSFENRYGYTSPINTPQIIHTFPSYDPHALGVMCSRTSQCSYDGHSWQKYLSPYVRSSPAYDASDAHCTVDGVHHGHDDDLDDLDLDSDPTVSIPPSSSLRSKSRTTISKPDFKITDIPPFPTPMVPFSMQLFSSLDAIPSPRLECASFCKNQSKCCSLTYTSPQSHVDSLNIQKSLTTQQKKNIEKPSRRPSSKIQAKPSDDDLEWTRMLSIPLSSCQVPTPSSQVWLLPSAVNVGSFVVTSDPTAVYLPYNSLNDYHPSSSSSQNVTNTTTPPAAVSHQKTNTDMATSWYDSVLYREDGFYHYVDRDNHHHRLVLPFPTPNLLVSATFDSPWKQFVTHYEYKNALREAYERTIPTHQRMKLKVPPTPPENPIEGDLLDKFTQVFGTFQLPMFVLSHANSTVSIKYTGHSSVHIPHPLNTIPPNSPKPLPYVFTIDRHSQLFKSTTPLSAMEIYFLAINDVLFNSGLMQLYNLDPSLSVDLYTRVEPSDEQDFAEDRQSYGSDHYHMKYIITLLCNHADKVSFLNQSMTEKGRMMFPGYDYQWVTSPFAPHTSSKQKNHHQHQDNTAAAMLEFSITVVLPYSALNKDTHALHLDAKHTNYNTHLNSKLQRIPWALPGISFNQHYYTCCHSSASYFKRIKCSEAMMSHYRQVLLHRNLVKHHLCLQQMNEWFFDKQIYSHLNNLLSSPATTISLFVPSTSSVAASGSSTTGGAGSTPSPSSTSPAAQTQSGASQNEVSDSPGKSRLQLRRVKAPAMEMKLEGKGVLARSMREKEVGSDSRYRSSSPTTTVNSYGLVHETIHPIPTFFYQLTEVLYGTKQWFSGSNLWDILNHALSTNSVGSLATSDDNLYQQAASFNAYYQQTSGLSSSMTLNHQLQDSVNITPLLFRSEIASTTLFTYILHIISRMVTSISSLVLDDELMKYFQPSYDYYLPFSLEDKRLFTTNSYTNLEPPVGNATLVYPSALTRPVKERPYNNHLNSFHYSNMSYLVLLKLMMSEPLIIETILRSVAADSGNQLNSTTTLDTPLRDRYDLPTALEYMDILQPLVKNIYKVDLDHNVTQIANAFSNSHLIHRAAGIIPSYSDPTFVKMLQSHYGAHLNHTTTTLDSNPSMNQTSSVTVQSDGQLPTIHLPMIRSLFEMISLHGVTTMVNSDTIPIFFNPTYLLPVHNSTYQFIWAIVTAILFVSACFHPYTFRWFFRGLIIRSHQALSCGNAHATPDSTALCSPTSSQDSTGPNHTARPTVESNPRPSGKAKGKGSKSSGKGGGSNSSISNSSNSRGSDRDKSKHSLLSAMIPSFKSPTAANTTTTTTATAATGEGYQQFNPLVCSHCNLLSMANIFTYTPFPTPTTSSTSSSPSLSAMQQGGLSSPASLSPTSIGSYSHQDIKACTHCVANYLAYTATPHSMLTSPSYVLWNTLLLVLSTLATFFHSLMMTFFTGITTDDDDHNEFSDSRTQQPQGSAQTPKKTALYSLGSSSNYQGQGGPSQPGSALHPPHIGAPSSGFHPSSTTTTTTQHADVFTIQYLYATDSLLTKTIYNNYYCNCFWCLLGHTYSLSNLISTRVPASASSSPFSSRSNIFGQELSPLQQQYRKEQEKSVSSLDRWSAALLTITPFSILDKFDINHRLVVNTPPAHRCMKLVFDELNDTISFLMMVSNSPHGSGGHSSPFSSEKSLTSSQRTIVGMSPSTPTATSTAAALEIPGPSPHGDTTNTSPAVEMKPPKRLADIGRSRGGKLSDLTQHHHQQQQQQQQQGQTLYASFSSFFSSSSSISSSDSTGGNSVASSHNASSGLLSFHTSSVNRVFLWVIDVYITVNLGILLVYMWAQCTMIERLYILLLIGLLCYYRYAQCYQSIVSSILQADGQFEHSITRKFLSIAFKSPHRLQYHPLYQPNPTTASKIANISELRWISGAQPVGNFSSSASGQKASMAQRYDAVKHFYTPFCEQLVYTQQLVHHSSPRSIVLYLRQRHQYRLFYQYYLYMLYKKVSPSNHRLGLSSSQSSTTTAAATGNDGQQQRAISDVPPPLLMVNTPSPPKTLAMPAVSLSLVSEDKPTSPSDSGPTTTKEGLNENTDGEEHFRHYMLYTLILCLTIYVPLFLTSDALILLLLFIILLLLVLPQVILSTPVISHHHRNSSTIGNNNLTYVDYKAQSIEPMVHVLANAASNSQFPFTPMHPPNANGITPLHQPSSSSGSSRMQQSNPPPFSPFSFYPASSEASSGGGNTPATPDDSVLSSGGKQPSAGLRKRR